MIPSLRPYQSSIVNGIRKAAEKNKRIIAVAPTGSGKTIIFCHIAWKAMQKNTRVFILVHREEILRQTIQKLSMFNLQCGVIKSGQKITANLIQVCMVQTLVNRMDILKHLGRCILIGDEIHHYTSPTFRKVWNGFNARMCLGFTATPARTDGVGLSDIAESMVIGPSTAALVNNKYLAEPVIMSSPLAKSISKAKAKIKDGEYDRDNETEIMSQKTIINETVDMYSMYFRGSPVVIFCASIPDCETVSSAMRAAGFKCETVHGKMDPEKRKQYIQDIGVGKLNAICSYDVISEGVDVPILSGVILRRRTTSLIIYLQQIGRSLRQAPGKDKALVIDQVGNVYRHGHPLLIREWSLEGNINEKEKEIKQTECPECLAVLMGRPRYCKYCGFVFKDNPNIGENPPIILAAPLEIVRPPDIGDNALEAASILEFGNGNSEKELIDRTLAALRNGDESARERFNAIMRMMNKQSMTERVWKSYVEPEYEKNNVDKSRRAL